MTIKYKILIAGDSGVGKTTLLDCFINNRFRDDFKRTIGVDISIKDLTINNLNFILSIWDVGGEDKFRSILNSCARKTDGVLFLFDLSNISTLNNIGEWILQIKELSPDVQLLLIGAKCDISKRTEKDLEFINKIIKHYKFFGYIETSSKLKHNIEKTFIAITKKLYDTIKII